MEGPLEQIPDHPKSPDFMYDSLNSLDYINYPLAAEPYGLAPLNLSSPLNDYAYIGASYTAGSPARPFTPTHIYPPVLSNLSAGEMSSDSMQSGRTSRGSGTHSPSLATVPRSHRYNPMSVMPPRTSGTRERKRRASKHEDFSDDDDDFQPVQTSNASNEVRREEIRRQRIESEQRRRDELRDGYRRLKDALPVSNQKSSKVSLLDRATTHIKYLEMTQQQLQTRLQQAESETQRLRQVNEALMLGTAEQRHAAAAAAVAAVQQQAPAAY
ncbi:hypothetical protein HETIRDRAFT_437588 [Heterobasidion irregulare TC 32-1]|uniref:BHLH domain-containing protein n=1 Tax=Heterobasidion irregulare (strain TC 32-1) TaxID=747525 RepID=W4KN85_HETIT|nr:uncharacterized protein HETIRDRAFT_437588 [Heterobasidion irregulare TC 32-1]ETW86835.1 hypothetical protein HETIRDRAFT_437588 [Heterobasidion irregulare TC 32-1]